MIDKINMKIDVKVIKVKFGLDISNKIKMREDEIFY